MERRVDLNSFNVVPRKGISWRAIFAGVVTILTVMFLLNLLGLVFGFGTINPTQEEHPFSGLGTGSLIWWLASNIIALFAGGYVAGRVGVSFYNKSGIVQGIMTWALYTVISIWLLTSAIGGIISGVGNTIGDLLSLGGGGQQEQQQQQQKRAQRQQSKQLDISWNQAKQEFYSILRDTDKPALDPDRIERKVEDVRQTAETQAQEARRNPGQVRSKVENIFSEARNEFDDTYDALDEQSLVNVLTERTDMSESEARSAVDNVSEKYESAREKSKQFLDQAKQKAQEAAGSITQAISDAALWSFIALVVGLIVAALGGLTGVKSLRSDYEDTEYLPSERRVGYDRRDEIS